MPDSVDERELARAREIVRCIPGSITICTTSSPCALHATIAHYGDARYREGMLRAAAIARERSELAAFGKQKRMALIIADAIEREIRG